MSNKNMNNAPNTKPATGDAIIGRTTFGHTPSFHLITDHFPLAAATAAPHSPPISAWLELDGNPNHHVAMFQTNAATTAESTVAIVTTSVSTNPLPIVEATAPPNNAPVRLKNAAIAIAWRGVSTRVDTTVAIAFAASWKPLLYSKMTAARKTTVGGRTRFVCYEYFSATCTMMFPASRQRSITFSKSP